MKSDDMREPFNGRFWGVFNVEGDDPSPLFMFHRRDEAAQELARRQALPEEHDDRLDEYHQLFPVDVAGAWWNSYDPDPRASSPLDVAEIVAVHKGDRNEVEKAKSEIRKVLAELAEARADQQKLVDETTCKNAEISRLSRERDDARADEKKRIVDALQERLDEARAPDAEDALCQAIAIARNAEGDLTPAEARAEAAPATTEKRPPCPGEGWEWDDFALQWFQPCANGPAIGRAF